jgi:hypothetical protein
MRIISAVIFGLLVYSGVSIAGGSIGGGGGSIQLETPELDLLQRVYVEDAAYRRLNARLSVDGVRTLPVLVGDENVEVQKIKSRVVDASVSREFLPLAGGTVGGGGSGIVFSD